nr:MAG TPA_asm: hypothetical protein [Bacteriophage sp.]
MLDQVHQYDKISKIIIETIFIKIYNKNIRRKDLAV